MVWRAFRWLLVLVALAACGAPTPAPKPVITVISPPDGSLYALGEPISINVASASSNDVARVELRVGVLALLQSNEPRSPAFSTRMTFTPTGVGTYSVTLTAFDAGGQPSDPLVWTATVAERVTFLSTPTPIPATAPADPCRLDTAFVSDVTIPDNTAVRANTAFTKTWRLRNASDCAWGPGYELVFVDRQKMAAPDAVGVAQTPRGGTVDVSVRFVGPALRGIYTSTWQMRSPAGTLFGQRVFVQIRVP